MQEGNYEITMNSDNDPTRTGNTRPQFFLSAMNRIEELPEQGQVGLIFKPMITTLGANKITRVEWIKDNIIIDAIDGDITYQWVLSSTPLIQEVINFSINIENPYFTNEIAMTEGEITG